MNVPYGRGWIVAHLDDTLFVKLDRLIEMLLEWGDRTFTLYAADRVSNGRIAGTNNRISVLYTSAYTSCLRIHHV